MKRSKIKAVKNSSIPDVKDLKLISQNCNVEKDGSLNFRWQWNNGYTKQFFVKSKEIEKSNSWVNKYSDGLMQ